MNVCERAGAGGISQPGFTDSHLTITNDESSSFAIMPKLNASNVARTVFARLCACEDCPVDSFPKRLLWISCASPLALRTRSAKQTMQQSVLEECVSLLCFVFHRLSPRRLPLQVH